VHEYFFVWPEEAFIFMLSKSILNSIPPKTSMLNSKMFVGRRIVSS